MEKRNSLLRLLWVALALTSTFLGAHGQADRSLVYMDLIPQRNQINPAFTPDYRLYVGIPFLSSVKVGFENTFRYDDIVIRRGDSLVLDRDHIYSRLSNESRANLNGGEEYIAFGLQHDENYFHFRLADQGQLQINVEKNMLSFLFYGTDSSYFVGNDVNLGGSAINMSYYREYAFGYARNVIPGLTAGVTLKYLQGIANFSTHSTDIFLQTDQTHSAITASTDIDINMSVPGLGSRNIKPRDWLPNIRNSGFAIDLGAAYKANPKTNLWASLLNLGSIGWKENLRNYKTTDPDKKVVFEGFDINKYFVDNSFDHDRLDHVLDSIANEFGITQSDEAYKTRLPAMLNLGGGYSFNRNDVLNVLLRSQFFDGYSQTTFSMAFTHRFNQRAQITISNTFYKSSALNPGVGFAGNLGPVQLYLMAENFTAPFSLNKTSIFIFRFGVNLVFAKNAANDKPTPPLK
jgi:hypothetical protein